MTYVDSLNVGNHHYILWYCGNYHYQIDVMHLAKKDQFTTVMNLLDTDHETAMKIFKAIGEESLI